MKNSIGKKTKPTKSLTKLLLPSAATGLVIATVISTLSTSVVAYEARSKLVTPAQVEKALSALLETRETNIQLAAYSPNKASTSSKQTVRYTPQARKIDHSNKSVAELIMAGLAITEQAKSELSSSANDQTSEQDSSAEQPELVEEALIAATPVAIEEADIIEAVIAAASVIVEEPVIVEAVIEEAAIAAAPVIIEEPVIVEEPVIEEAAIAAAPVIVEEPVLAQLKTMSKSSLEAQDNEELPALPVPMQRKTAETAATANIETPNSTVHDAKPELAAEIDSAETETNELETEESELLLASVSATTLPTEIDSGVNTAMHSNLVDNIGANVDVAIRSEGCPENFNKISIPVNGKLCQIFAADFPASMILFVPETPEDVIKYYLASSDSFVEPKIIKKRTMLKSADNNTTLIISKDGGGTQVDILVKVPAS